MNEQDQAEAVINAMSDVSWWRLKHDSQPDDHNYWYWDGSKCWYTSKAMDWELIPSRYMPPIDPEYHEQTQHPWHELVSSAAKQLNSPQARKRRREESFDPYYTQAT